MAERTGYNVNKAKELMENVKDCYDKLGGVLAEQWLDTRATLHQNWVGEDEQGFESTLADKISSMYVNTYEMATSAVQTVYDLAKAWSDFQLKNRLEGDKTATSAVFTLEPLQLTRNDKIITAMITEIGEDVDRGLVSENSASTIKQSLEDYKSNIRSRINEMIDAVSVDSAFFGEQSQTIKKYVEKVGSAMGEVMTAIKDMYDAVDVLAGSSYSQASSDVSSKFSEGESKIESSLENLGESRWK